MQKEAYVQPIATARLIPIQPDTTIDHAEIIRKAPNSYDFYQAILSEAELVGIRLPERRFIADGLIMEESINIINGFRGHGKSWFVLALANAITWGTEVGAWRVVNPSNVLYIDGEMPLSIIQERLNLLNKGIDVGQKPATLYFYPEAYAYRIGLYRSSILDRRWRDNIYSCAVDLGVRLLILDNLSSLAPGIDENDKMPFDPVNRWLLELRFKGITTIMTHHTGKSGEQRGTTAHEDHVDVALLLRHSSGYRHDQGCRFSCSVTKDRAHVTKDLACSLQLVENARGGLEFAVVEEEGLDKAMRLVAADSSLTQVEALKLYGISQRTFYRAKQKVKNGRAK